MIRDKLLNFLKEKSLVKKTRIMKLKENIVWHVVHFSPHMMGQYCSTSFTFFLPCKQFHKSLAPKLCQRYKILVLLGNNELSPRMVDK